MQGAGIGVTPYAAVLRQLVHEYNRSLCAGCKKVGASETLNPKPQNLALLSTQFMSGPGCIIGFRV